jgi:hypothetical protein
MTPQQFVGTAARLFSLFMLSVTLRMFGVVRAFQDQLPNAGAWVYLMPLSTFALALFLWLFPMTVAHKLIPRTEHTNTINLAAREMAAVGTVVLGLWVLLDSLPHMGSMFIVAVAQGSAFAQMYWSGMHGIEQISIGLRCLLGLLLVFRPWLIADKVFARAN